MFFEELGVSGVIYMQNVIGLQNAIYMSVEALKNRDLLAAVCSLILLAKNYVLEACFQVKMDDFF